MPELHMEGLDALEVAEFVDQGLASLNARLTDDGSREAEFPDLSTSEQTDILIAVERACEAWDDLANLLPGLREAGS